MAQPTETARAKLAEDFKAVIADTEELLRATANQTGERVTAARARVEERLNSARAALAEVGEDALARGKAAARTTDAYVRAHPWKSIGAAAAAGLIVGLLTRKR